MIDAFRRKGGKISDGIGKMDKKKESAAELFEEYDEETEKQRNREIEGREMKKFWLRSGSRFRYERLVMVVVIGAMVIGGLIWAGVSLFSGEGEIIAVDKDGEGSKVKVAGEMSGWQAVFLVGGQTYFGRVDGVRDGFLVMRNIYYLTNMTNTTNETNDEAEVGGGTKLVKFGTELHKPLDMLKINIGQVVMIEELSKESEVVKAIEEYEDNIDDK